MVLVSDIGDFMRGNAYPSCNQYDTTLAMCGMKSGNKKNVRKY